MVKARYFYDHGFVLLHSVIVVSQFVSLKFLRNLLLSIYIYIYKNLKCVITFTGELHVTFYKLLNAHVQLFNISVLFAQVVVL